MKNKPRHLAAIISCILVASFCLFLLYRYKTRARVENEAYYIRTIDGDTAVFEIDNEEVTCRFLAIDAPEYGEEYYGEAREYVKDTLEKGKTIVLESEPKSDEYDKYDRKLVWVFVDDELLQGKLLEEGLVKIAYTYGNYDYLSSLRESENRAKDNSRGIWGIEKDQQ